ncbi:unnamed protein product [Spirodela intermedia]|uniref:2-isopropylmalate synthase n=1 Tax=Spirodela intermedia TaxID=51605 RepID=A0A7I8IRE0_SPIIN|nr:unnamed protein product [Spirodela intermedia]CAA6660126.1 unnamed protein product [Spirodela intermedia]
MAPSLLCPNPNPKLSLPFSWRPCPPRSRAAFFPRPFPGQSSSGYLAGHIKCSLGSRPEYIPNRIPDQNYVRIFDTTLRDGEQSPGATMTSAEKLAVARQLSSSELTLSRPGSLPHRHIPVICGLSRCNKKDIDAAWEAVKHAQKPRIHTFIATSDVHLQFKLRKTREEVVNLAREMVAYARSLGCQDVEFSPEDAGRSDRVFLYHILEEVIKAGATTLNIPDTVGDIKANTPGIENVIISTHCQNDLGLATANTLAGAQGGARQLEVTVNGIGERAGNASLEEVVMAIKMRRELLGGLYTGINTKHIVMSSKMVQEHSGLHVQPHKAIVGANAFAHESGIHQDGMLKFKGTYEIISPEDIGLTRSNESGIVLGKLSGRHALRSRLLEFGYDINGKELDDVFKRFKEVAEKKKHVSDDDIEALINDEIFQPQVVLVTCGTLGLSTATVKLIGADGEEKIACCVGTGPVDAAYKAVDTIVKVPVTLLEYSMNAVTEGIDAIASTRVVIGGEHERSSMLAATGEKVRRTFSGTGAGMDIVVSSVRAYVSALNKVLGFRILSSDKSSAGKSRESS